MFSRNKFFYSFFMQHLWGVASEKSRLFVPKMCKNISLNLISRCIVVRHRIVLMVLFKHLWWGFLRKSLTAAKRCKPFLEKSSITDVCRRSQFFRSNTSKKVFLKIRKTRRKTPLSESLWIPFLIKLQMWHLQQYENETPKFLGTPFLHLFIFRNTSGDCFCNW